MFPCEIKSSLKSKVSMLNFPEQNIDPKRQFLRRMPYSAFVPKIFVEIKEFVNNCVKFADGLNSRYNIY